MKKILAALSLLLITFSCDVIGEDERFIEVEETTVNKRVLLEDFTGWRCVNCPEAAEVASELKKQYGENFIVVSLHPAGDINTDPAGGIGPDFQTEEAKAYQEYFKPEGFPVGMIDRFSFGSNSVLYYKEDWINYVQARLSEKTIVELELSCESVEEDSNSIVISASIKALNTIEENLVLQLWLTENKIIAPQLIKGGKGVIEEYEHNHVLRKAINGVWGEEVPDLNDAENFTVEMNYNYTVDSKFKIENCTVVGFVYKASTKEVLQSDEIVIVN